MTREQQEFEYYCLDRIMPLTEEFPVVYKDGDILRKLYFKVGLKAKIKHIDCIVIYSAVNFEDNLERFMFIPADIFYDNQKRFFTEVLTAEEVKTMIKILPAINIFEYTSLLEFTKIYKEYKELVEENWEKLDMNNLIEI